MHIFSASTLGVFMSVSLAVSAMAVGSPPVAKNDVLKPAARPAGVNVPTTEGVPHVTRLPNGLTVLVMEDARFPLVSTRLYVHAGSTYETPAEAGISHVLEHMVFKGTDKRPKGAVAKEVEAAGGYLNAATSFDYTMYLTDMPAREWKLGMDVVRDMAFHSTLDAAELESEKTVVLAELQRGKDNPSSRLFEAIQSGTLAGTPYDHPIIGFPDTIKGLTVAAMRAYIAHYYQPQSMLLVVVGDIDAAAVLAEAEAQFSAYTNTTPLVEPQPLTVDGIKPDTLTGKVVIQPGPWNKVYLAAALPVPGMDDVRTVPLDVLAHLLGGDQTSLFWKTYKYERQLVDSISVYNMNFERLGVLYISAELDADKVAPFWKALTEDLASLKASRFTPQDIARAKLNLEDDLYRSKETLSGLASKIGHFQFFTGDSAMGERNAINGLRAVDVNQIQEAIDLWLAPERLTTVMLPPESAKTAAAMPDAAQLTATLRANWPARGVDAAATAGPIASTPESIDLGQGRTLVLIPDATLPYVSATLSFTGGDSLLTPEQQGLASLTARALTKGTAARSAPDMQVWLADRAAGLSASAGRQSFTVSLSTPSRFDRDLLTMMGEVVREPAFAPAEISREKQSQAAAIRSRDDQPLGLVFRRLPEFLFPGSVYGYTPLGQASQVERYTPEQVRTFWDAQRQQPWVLAVAGQFDRATVLAAAKKLPVPDHKAVTPPAPTWGTNHALNLTMPGRNQAHYLLIFKTVPMDSPDAPGLELLQNILAGQSGLLFRDLRDDKGLGYTVTAFNSTAPQAGYMAFYIGTEPGKLPEAEAGFARVLNTLHSQLLPEDELNRGKSQMEGDYYRDRQTLGSRAGEAASLTLLDKPLSYNREQINRAAAVQPKELQQLAKKYLRLDDAYKVTLLP